MTAAPHSSIVIQMHGVAAGSMRDLHTTVAENVNWEVSAGDFWVVGGLQGAGKSDFLMLVGGLMGPRAGTYLFFDQQMPIFDEARLAERLRLGLVFDGGQLLNHLTISENIALPLRYHRNLTKEEAADQVQRMMDFTGLAPFADSTPGAIGRNWCKRAGLARALMLQPEVLLLDNPLGGLDLRHRFWWLTVLEQLSRGHQVTNGRPVTLIVTADDFRPWRRQGKQFAMLKGHEFLVLGDWNQVEGATDEQVRELVAMMTPGNEPM